MYQSTKVMSSDQRGSALRKENVCDAFADNVSVCGVRELYCERDWNIRILFGCGLVLSIGFACFSSYSMILQHLDQETVFDMAFPSDAHIFFPNVTICALSQLNFTAAREKVVISENVEKALKKLNRSREEFVNQTAVWMSSSSSLQRKSEAKLIRWQLEAFDDSMAALEGGMSDLLRDTVPSCPSTLQQCYVNEQWVDCCAEAVFNVYEGMACYELPVHQYLVNQTTPPTRPFYHAKLDVYAQLDWRHVPYMFEDDATDGFLLTINEPISTMTVQPVAVAGGWHATIRLSTPTKEDSLTQCLSPQNVPQLRRYSYYDGNGFYCRLDKAGQLYNLLLGCETPSMTYFPNHTTACHAIHLYTIVQALNVFTNTSSSFTIDQNILKKNKYYQNLADQVLEAMSVGDCKPLCNRWQYLALVGYSELAVPDSLDPQISTSRITVLIANEFYQVRIEQPPLSPYVLLSNIGGSLGTCAGCSIITFAQIIFYGLYTCHIRRKKRKIAPISA